MSFTNLAWRNNFNLKTFPRISVRQIHPFLLPGAGNNNEGYLEIETDQDPEHSTELRELIRMYLRPIPEHRASVTELLAKINLARKALSEYAKTIQGPKQ